MRKRIIIMKTIRSSGQELPIDCCLIKLYSVVLKPLAHQAGVGIMGVEFGVRGSEFSVQGMVTHYSEL